MTILLDSTVLIDTLRSRAGRSAQLTGMLSAGHTLATAAINVAEVYAGMRRGEESKTGAFLSSLDCFPVDRATRWRSERELLAY